MPIEPRLSSQALEAMQNMNALPECLPRMCSFAALLTLVLGPGTSAQAGRELSEYEYSLRFPAATSRFAPYADVASLGGAQVGSRWSSSLNPASAAWPHPERRFRNSLAAQFSTVHFAEGSRFDIYAEAPVIDAGKWGVFLPAVAQIRGNDATVRKPAGALKGPEMGFEADFFQLQWGKLVHEQWAIGAVASITTSKTRFDQDRLELSVSRAEAYQFRVGVLHQPIDKVRVGAAVEYGATPTRTRALVGFNPLTGLPVRVRTSDTTHQILLRTGLTWEYAKGCDFYLDYHGGVFWDDSGEFWIHRFPVGVEQMIIPDILFARIGATIDTRGHTVLAAGLGVSLGSRASLDLAYQNSALPEIRPELGAADAFVFSLAVWF